MCIPCQGEGRVILHGLVFDRVRELRAEYASYRTIAQIIYEEFDGDWQPSYSSLVGESLCDMAGIDRHAEFKEYCAWRAEQAKEKTHGHRS